MSRRGWIALAACAFAAVGCSLVFPVPDANGNVDGGVVVQKTTDAGSEGAEDASLASDSGSTMVVEAGVPACTQTGHGAALVPAGDRLCIDATPVTRDEYRAFLAAAVPLAPQISGCTGNASWIPLGPLDAGSTMVDGVDWCDAWGYCAWAGKTLCGGFPGDVLDGGVEPDGGFIHGIGQDQGNDRDASAMAWACEGGDAELMYPYGNDEDPTQCYEQDFAPPPQPEPGPVGSTGCAGGFPGLVDMVGVVQWIDACSGAFCLAVGAQECRGVTAFEPALSAAYYPSNQQLVGFRCCGLEAPRR